MFYWDIQLDIRLTRFYLVNKHVHITRDIVFFEDIFSLHSLSKPNAPSIPSYIPINSTYFLDLNFTLLSQNDDVSSN